MPSSALKELLKRRVPQILGIYLGISWAIVEAVGFLVDRYLLSTYLVDLCIVILELAGDAVGNEQHADIAVLDAQFAGHEVVDPKVGDQVAPRAARALRLVIALMTTLFIAISLTNLILPLYDNVPASPALIMLLVWVPALLIILLCAVLFIDRISRKPA